MKVLNPRSGLPARGFGKETRLPRESNFEGQWDLITGFPHDWGKALLTGTNKILCAPGSTGKREVTPQETELDLPASDGGSSVESWIASGLLQGWGRWQQQS